MKKILPILLIFILIVSACSGEKEEKKKDAKKESNQIVEADGTLNLKNYLHKKGNFAYLVSNEDGSQNLSEETRVEAIVLSEGKKIKLYNSGFDNPNPIRIKQLNKIDSKQQMKDFSKLIDNEIYKEFITDLNNTAKRKTDIYNKSSEDGEEIEYQPEKSKYSEPKSRELIYEVGEDINKNKATFINVKPRTLYNNTNISKFNKPKLVEENNEKKGFNFSDVLPLTKVNNKNYIGLSTISDDHNEARMIIVEAPKGTKKISSGL